MESYEDIHEKMVALREENARLRTDAAHADLLLSALASLLRLDLDADPFASLFDSLRAVLAFDQAMALICTDEDSLVCVTAEPPLSRDVTWPAGRFFSKVMSGRVSATFSNAAIAEWRDIAADVLSPDHPGLYLPLRVRDERGVLVLLRTGEGAGFDRDDIALAQKFSLAASHALAGSEDRRIIHENMARALAAEEASKAKDLFIANMSHELRTSLNAIIGFSEILGDADMLETLGEQSVDYALDIHASGRHLLSIVDNLLLYTRIEAGRLTVDASPFDIGEEIAFVLRLLDLEAGRRGVRLESDIVAGDGTVLADRQSLRQILLNVIGNAIKFSDRGKTVRLCRRDHGDTAIFAFAIEDSGCGMSANLLAEIGKPFVQGDASSSRRHEGTGLGLAISFGLVQAMGADLSVDSIPGQGTSVTLTIPMAPGRRADRPRTPVAVARASAP